MKLDETANVLFTTMYPEGKKFFHDFVRSIKYQSNQKFDLWIGLDRIQQSEVEVLFGTYKNVTYITRQIGESAASLRQRAIEQMIRRYEGIIFVDSDDILEPTRVEVAGKMLSTSDVGGCALSIINENGESTQHTLNYPDDEIISSKIPLCFNIYGLSNTVYQTSILKKCLPIPDDCILVDWFLATSAWIRGAKFSFDLIPRMQYRQYTQNTARIVPPFTSEYILRATKMVISHYYEILTYVPDIPEKHLFLLEEQHYKVTRFLEIMENNLEKMNIYIQKLNKMPSDHIWWDMVAHPHLDNIWKN